MLIAIIFIVTSILQFFSYQKNNNREKRINDFLITITFMLIYILVYTFLFYTFYKDFNLMNFSFNFQVLVVGSIGTVFTLITNIFWFFEKRRNI